MTKVYTVIWSTITDESSENTRTTAKSAVIAESVQKAMDLVKKRFALSDDDISSVRLNG